MLSDHAAGRRPRGDELHLQVGARAGHGISHHVVSHYVYAPDMLRSARTTRWAPYCWCSTRALLLMRLTAGPAYSLSLRESGSIRSGPIATTAA